MGWQADTTFHGMICVMTGSLSEAILDAPSDLICITEVLTLK